MGEILIHWMGSTIVVNDDIRHVVYNPVTGLEYPKVGDVIALKKHGMLSNGTYLVCEVTEYDPSRRADINGRDIRITVCDKFGLKHYDMNGSGLVKAIVNRS
jgi:hypothetical protein